MLKKYIIFSILLSYIIGSASIMAEHKPPWTGKLKDGTVITHKDLNKILNDHKKWIEKVRDRFAKLSDDDKEDPLRADLRGAYLSGAILQFCDLSYANLWGIDLSGADLQFGNLSRAKLGDANLRGINLFSANLSECKLTRSDLSGADMLGTDLSGALLYKANLDNVIYEPRTPPDFYNNIRWARNISGLRYKSYPLELMELRMEFKKNGLRDLEKKITYAIKRTERMHLVSGKNIDSTEGLFFYRFLNKIEGYFQYFLFEITCLYGMYPGRPLLILFLIIIPLFSLVYFKVLRCPKKNDGIYMEWIETRIRKDLGKNEPEMLKLTTVKALLFGMYFSVLSAFSMGYRDLNVGNWISRIQPREYNLKATGWVRMVSGIQSLISVYMLALWVLTYFGRPFG